MLSLLLSLGAALVPAQEPPGSGSELGSGSGSAPEELTDQEDRQRQILERYEQLVRRDLSREVYLQEIWEQATQLDLVEDRLERWLGQSREGDDAAAAVLAGFFQEMLGRPALAAEAYTQAVELDPDLIAARLRLAQLRARQQEYPEALEQLQNAEERLREERAAESAGQDAAAASRDRAATELLRQVYEQQAQVYLATFEREKAADIYRQIVGLNPDDVPLRLKIAEETEQRGLLEVTVEQLEAVAQRVSAEQRTEIYQTLARVEMLRDNLDAAAQALQQALDLTAPGNWLRGRLLEKLVRIRERQGELDQLRERLTEAHRQAPRDLGALMDLRVLTRETGSLEEQYEIQKKIRDLAPTNAESHLLLADLAERLGRPEEAREILTQLKLARPGDYAVAFALADLELRVGDREAALEQVRQIRAENRQNAALLSLVEDWLRKNQLEEALEDHLRLVLQSAPMDDAAALRLADLLAQRGRAAEAVQAMETLLANAAGNLQRAALHARLADILRRHGALREAMESLRQAAGEDPGDLNYQLTLAEMYFELNALNEARQTVEQVLARAVSEEGQSAGFAQADRLYFTILKEQAVNNRSSQAKALPVERHSLPQAPSFHDPQFTQPGFPGVNKEEPQGPLEQQIAVLREVAETTGSPEHHLRAARWLYWNEEFLEAQQHLREILEEEPRNTQARDLFLTLIAEGFPSRQSALEALEWFAALDEESAREPALMKQLGRLYLEQGEVDRALDLLQKAVELRPREVQPLLDLAVAQQRAGLWYDALETWDKAYHLTGPGSQLAILRPYLAALERLQLKDRAERFLRQALEQASAEEEKLRIAEEMTAFAARTQRLEKLRDRLEQQLEQQPNSPFLRQFLAQVLKAAGDTAGARQYLEDVAGLAEDPAAVLRRLAERAQQEERWDDALDYMTQVLRHSPRAADYQALAALQERTWRFEAALETWQRLLREFPGDAQLTLEAARTHARIGDDPTAQDLYTETLTLQPDNPEVRLELALLLEKQGRLDAALEQYKLVLQVTESFTLEDTGQTIVYPPLEVPEVQDLREILNRSLELVESRRFSREREQLKLFWRPDRVWSPTVRRGLEPRLVAIRNSSRIYNQRGLRDEDPAWRKWITRWLNSGNFTEKLWAFYYSGAKRDLWLHLAAPDSVDPASSEGQFQAMQNFVWLQLSAGNAQRLGGWLTQEEGDRALRRYHFLLALAQWVPARLWNGEPVDDVREMLSMHVFDWDFMQRCAQIFFEAGYLEGAADTAALAAQSAPLLQKAEALDEAANFYLLLGRQQAARETTQPLMDTPADYTLRDFSQAVHMRMQLSDEMQRREMILRLETMKPDAIPPAHKEFALALLNGAGEHGREQALVHLGNFQQLRSLSWEGRSGAGAADTTYSYWNTILRAGLALKGWEMPELASELWSRALHQRRRMIVEDPDSRRSIELIRRLNVTLQLWSMPFAAENPAIRQFLAEVEDPMETRTLSGVLEDQRFYSEALQLVESLVKDNPREEEVLRERIYRLQLLSGDYESVHQTLALLRRQAGLEGEPGSAEPDGPGLTASEEIEIDDEPGAEDEEPGASDAEEDPDRALERRQMHMARYREWKDLLAEDYLSRGLLWHSFETYRPSQPQGPEDINALQHLVVIGDRLQFDALAAEYCEQLLQYYHERPEIYSQWARNMQNSGEAGPALERLEAVFPEGHSSRTQILPVLFNLNLALEKKEAAFELASQIVVLDFPVSMLLEMVQAFRDVSEPRAARELLELAVKQQHSAGYLITAEQVLLDQYLSGDQLTEAQVLDRRRHLRRLEHLYRLAPDAPAEVGALLAQAAGEENGLNPEWFQARWAPENSPAQGDPRGVVMNARRLIRDDRMPELKELVTEFFGRRLHDQAAQTELLRVLREQGVDPAIILDGLRHLHEAYPELISHGLEYAMQLHRQNQPELALEVLRDLSARRIAPAATPEIARAYAQLGHAQRAAELLERVSPIAYSQFPALLETWLELFCDSPRQEQTRRLLATYYRRGGQINMDPLVQWLECRDHLDTPETAVEWLRLSDRQTLLLRRTLLQRALHEQNAQRARLMVDRGAIKTLTDSQDLRAAAKLLPQHFEVARHLSQILATRRQWDDAATILQRYLAAAPQDAPDRDEAARLLREYQSGGEEIVP